MMPKMTAYPPPSYGDLGELEKIFASSFPEMITQMSGLLGKRTPRLKKKDVARQKAKLRKFLVTSRAYLLGLRALSGEPDRAKCVYALLEGLLREQLRAGGKGIPAGKDSFEFLLMATERAASSPNQAWAKLAAYYRRNYGGVVPVQRRKEAHSIWHSVAKRGPTILRRITKEVDDQTRQPACKRIPNE
jgi:hypothetical protein